MVEVVHEIEACGLGGDRRSTSIRFCCTGLRCQSEAQAATFCLTVIRALRGSRRHRDKRLSEILRIVDSMFESCAASSSSRFARSQINADTKDSCTMGVVADARPGQARPLYPRSHLRCSAYGTCEYRGQPAAGVGFGPELVSMGRRH